MLRELTFKDYHMIDTVHHEMDSVTHIHHVYKSMWLPVIGEQLILEKEPAGHST